MEGLFGKSKTTNKDAFSDPSNRMSQRPGSVKSGEGLGFQELSSTFGPTKPTVTYVKSTKNKSKPAARPPVGPRKVPPRIAEDESDDELLLSSQTSTGGDATPSSKRVAKGLKTNISSDKEETVRVNGRVLAAHPNYKPSSLTALKALRFTKNKSVSADNVVAEMPPPSSSLDDSQDLFKSISDDVEILDDPPAGSPTAPRSKPSATSPTRRRSPNMTRIAARPLLGINRPSTSKPSSPPVKDTAQPPVKPRPRPRVIIRHRDSSPESTPRPAVQRRGYPLHNKTLERPTNAESKRTVKQPLSSSRREPQEFPMSLQAKENVSDGARSGDASSSRTKKISLSRAATFVHNPKPIPLPSPLKTKPISRTTTFPNLSPLFSSKDKGKARAKTPDEDDVKPTDGQGKHAGPKPFPMSSQMLAGIDGRPKSPSIRSVKRTSSDGSGTEQGRTAKKRKDLSSGVLDPFDYLHEPMEDDSLELGYARDPSKLCPYCDEELPSHPTPFLRNLLATARKKSVSDPRPRNRGGLKAPLTVYISVCQRHRFESHQLPIATERGWPKTIDFTKVPARVKKMKNELEAIILDKDDTSDIEDLDTEDWRKGPRGKSIFWREVKKEVKKQGSRAVTGVKGQFASFEKTQPGYYGEQGSVIIHQTLFDLFPPSTFDAYLIAPLSPAEFIQHVLVPEAAVRLIVQDLCIDMDDAVVTLRDSAQYGVAMFPDTGENKRKGTTGDDDEMGVADRIVMERARIRRRELAEEEEVEKEMLEKERAAQRAKARESRREKAVERAQQARQNKARVEAKTEADGLSEASEANTTHRTRPRQQAVEGDAESDAMSVDSLASKRPARTSKKAGRGNGTNGIRATPRPNDSGSELGGSKPKANIRRSTTRERSTGPTARVSTETTISRERTKPFGGFASLDSDGERENTPRPSRQRRADTNNTESAINGSHARVLPLQTARNRPGVSMPMSHDGWSRSLRTNVPDDVDSDASNASRRSQRLVRLPIKKGKSYSWLLSDRSSPDSS